MTVPETLPNRPDDALRAQLERVLEANYELSQEIGRGGMGIVFRARDRRLKRLVAVKLLPPDLAYRADIRSRFLREAETSAQLAHPCIVPIYTVEEADNLVFFIMGYVNGDTIAARLRERGPMAPDEARRILIEVSDALSYAHARNVVHRDIKPDNIMLDNDTGRAMVTDFGIARAVSEGSDARLTTTGLAIGTPAYMSPEQCAGDRGVDGRSDLYSLGVVGYEMLTGQLPFSAGNTPAMFVKHLTEAPRPLPANLNIPGDLGAIIMRCLAKNPEDRFANAGEMVEALNGNGPLPGGVSGKQTTRGYQTQQSQRQTNVAALPQQASQMRSMPTNAARAIEMGRWEAPPVRAYRKKVTSFALGSLGLITVGVLFSHSFFFFDGLWGIAIASGYAKVLHRGYDWRDVFRQPRDALFADVVNEKIDDARALFDPAKRDIARERLRARMREGAGNNYSPVPELQGSSSLANVTGFSTPLSLANGATMPEIQEAAAARADIQRMMVNLNENDRRSIPDVGSYADQLYGRIELLAASISDLDRANVPGMGEAIDREITELENEANPFDEEASEARVRRLMSLRRQKLSLRDSIARRSTASEKLSRAVLAMRTMRTDLARLSAGTRSYDSVTQVAEQAMQVGREVDAVLYSQEEMHSLLKRDG